MTSHRDILTGLARAIQASTDVADYCRRNFGRALAINVGAYAQGIPNESHSPFLWIHAADDENESVGSEDTFTARLVVAGCVKGEAGENYIENVVAERTETAVFQQGDFFAVEPFVSHSMFFPEDCVMVQMYDPPVEQPDGGKDIYGEALLLAEQNGG